MEGYNASVYGQTAPPVLTVQFDCSNYVVGEAGGSAAIIVTLSDVPTQTVTVDYTTSDGTAVAGTNYQATSGTLTFDPDQVVQLVWFDVPVISDGLPGPNLTVNLILSNPQNAILGTPSTAVLTILDDTPPPLPSVSFSAASYSVNVTAGISTITVNLSASSSDTVSVYYATSDGTAVNPADYQSSAGCLSFAANETTKTFQISVTDGYVAGVNKTVELALSSPQNADLGSPSAAELTIINDNSPPPSGTVQFAHGDGGSSPPIYIVNKAQGVAEITVVNAPSSQSVSVDYATSDGTAVAPDEYTPAAGTLTLSPNQASGTFEVNLNQGSAAQVDVSVNLALANPVNALLGLLSTALLEIEEKKPTATINPGTGQAGTTGDVVKSVKGNAGTKHYVSPKKAADFVVVKAAVTGAKVAFDKAFTWGVGGVAGTNTDERKVARDATGAGPTTLTIIRKSDLVVVDTMNVWIVWATWSGETKNRVPLAVKNGKLKPQIGAVAPGFYVSSYWTFQVTIAPASILDVTKDVPALNGASTKPVPGATNRHVATNQVLGGGPTFAGICRGNCESAICFLRCGREIFLRHLASFGRACQTRTWSQQTIRRTKLKGMMTPRLGRRTITPIDATGLFWKPNGVNVLNPLGAMSNVDRPTVPQFIHSAGANGDTAEQRNQFREFARLQIGDSAAAGYRNWYRISDYYLWRQHGKLKKVAGSWVDDGSVADATNAGW
jgi:hypothetical protein